MYRTYCTFQRENKEVERGKCGIRMSQKSEIAERVDWCKCSSASSVP